MAAGTRDTLKGKIKAATGVLLGDKQLEREGKVDKAVGALKATAAKAVDKLRDAVAPAKRSPKSRTR